MRDLQLIVRGGEAALRERPLAVLLLLPHRAPQVSDVTSQNVVDCARSASRWSSIPMPARRVMSPVTLVGSLVQQTAET